MAARAQVLLVVLLVGSPLPALAQQSLSSTVEPGARLRLTLAPGHARLVGRLVRLRGDSIELQVGTALVPDTQLIAAQRVTRIEVSVGRHHPVGKSAVLGGAIGLLAGGLLGALVPSNPTLGNGGFYYWTRGGTVALWPRSAPGAASWQGLPRVSSAPNGGLLPGSPLLGRGRPG
jgi:hypothetical protein